MSKIAPVWRAFVTTLATLSVVLLQMGKPNAVRFYPPTPSPVWFPYFRALNHWFLQCAFRGQQLILSPSLDKALATLDNCSHPVLIIANHTNFKDPHVLFELGLRYGRYFYWMAGREPFERLKGLFAWHITRSGVFSVDRGRSDRLAIKTAIQCLLSKKAPLVLFPEGEASYRNGCLQPFQKGVAFILNQAFSTLQKSAPQQTADIFVLPIAIRYRFVSTQYPRIQQQICKELYRLEKCLRSNLSNLSALSSHQATHIQAILAQQDFGSLCLATRTILEGCVACLWLDKGLGNYVLEKAPLADGICTLVLRLVQDLSARHHVPVDPTLLEKLSAKNPDLSDFEAVFSLKNTVRSTIAHKLFAPGSSVYNTCSSFVSKYPDSPGWIRWVSVPVLSLLSKQWIGSPSFGKGTDDDPRQLASTLKGVFTGMAADVAAKSQADEQTLFQWQEDLNDCRRIKLLALLLQDLPALYGDEEMSLEALDGVLCKLSLLIRNKTPYRGPMAVTLDSTGFESFQRMLASKQENRLGADRLQGISDCLQSQLSNCLGLSTC